MYRQKSEKALLGGGAIAPPPPPPPLATLMRLGKNSVPDDNIPRKKKVNNSLCIYASDSADSLQ